MTNIKLQLLLLLFVVLCVICSTDIIEGNRTFQWPNYTGSAADISGGDCSENTTGVQGITSCKVASDECYNTVTNSLKQVGEPCTINNMNGTCREDNEHKLLCMVDTDSIISNNQTIANSPVSSPQPLVSSSDNVYVIQKVGGEKTHSPACVEPTSASCDNLITQEGSLICGEETNDCCLCNSGPTKWNRVYTSKYGDELQGDSKSLNELPDLFTNYSEDNTPSRSEFNVVKLNNNNYGIYTDNNPAEFKRLFKIRDYVNNQAPDNRYYAPSKGYFMNNQTEINFDISQFPGYIASGENTQLQDDFYYEQCLYDSVTEEGSTTCQCGANQTVNSQSPTNNPLCNNCPDGSTNSGDSTCQPCSDQNKVYDESIGSCSPCVTVGANDRHIYRVNDSNIGMCPSLNNVANSGVIRSDCVPSASSTGNQNCDVTSYGSISGDEALYHLSTNQNNENNGSLNEFYNACLALEQDCQVVQSLIGDNEEASIESYIESYINFNDPQPSIALPAVSSFNEEYNMITNEYCRDITNQSQCNQLKQCNWKANAETDGGTCLIDVNKNNIQSTGLIYKFIPVPEFKPVISSDDTYMNYLSTECSGRIESDCNSDSKCHWSNGVCESECNTKETQTSCNTDNTCMWNTNVSPPTCSKRDVQYCGVPSITTTDRYRLTNNMGQNTSEIGFNSNVRCSGLLDMSTGEYSGDAKGICFSGEVGSTENTLKKTGCIPSHIMNNLTLFKSQDTIDSANGIASDEGDFSSVRASPEYSELEGAPLLLNRCRELCSKDDDCIEYGVKFPTSASPAGDEGCYLITPDCGVDEYFNTSSMACTQDEITLKYYYDSSTGYLHIYIDDTYDVIKNVFAMYAAQSDPSTISLNIPESDIITTSTPFTFAGNNDLMYHSSGDQIRTTGTQTVDLATGVLTSRDTYTVDEGVIFITSDDYILPNDTMGNGETGKEILTLLNPSQGGLTFSLVGFYNTIDETRVKWQITNIQFTIPDFTSLSGGNSETGNIGDYTLSLTYIHIRGDINGQNEQNEQNGQPYDTSLYYSLPCPYDSSPRLDADRNCSSIYGCSDGVVNVPDLLYLMGEMATSLESDGDDFVGYPVDAHPSPGCIENPSGDIVCQDHYGNGQINVHDQLGLLSAYAINYNTFPCNQ